MKHFKRSLALFLAFVMLIGLFPVGVFAEGLHLPEGQNDVLESDVIPLPITMKAGDKKTLNFSAGEIKTINFTPESDGIYAFYSESDADTYGELFDANDDFLEYSDDNGEGMNFYIQKALEAGKTYHLHTGFLNEEESGSFVVVIEKKNAPTAMNFSVDNFKKVTEGVCEYELSLVFGPENAAMEEITVSIGNSEILSHNYNYYKYTENVVYVSLRALAEGVTTVTATTKSGLTDTIEITVVAASSLSLDETHSITTPSDVYGYSAIFTIPKDGTYLAAAENFDSEIDYNYCFINAETGEYFYSYGFQQFQLAEGDYYYVMTFGEFLGNNVKFDLTVKEISAASAVKITNESLTGLVGEELRVSYEFYPEDAIIESVTITSDNPDVVEVNEWMDLVLVSPGTATITITSESGLTDSALVTVSDRPQAEAIQLSEDRATAYVGVPMDIWVWAEPDDAEAGEITWSISDPTMGTVTPTESSHQVSIVFTRPGTVTVTARNEDGLEDSCVIVIEEMLFMTEESPVTTTLDYYTSRMICFTASASGKYRIKAAEALAAPLSLELYDENFEMVASSMDLSYIDYEFSADQSYYVCVYLDSENEMELTICATPLVDATSLALSESALTGAIKESATLKAIFSPANAFTEKVFYEIANPEIASISMVNNCDARVYFMKEGVTTVTATSESGKTATATITVRKPDALTLDQEKTVTVYEGRETALVFSPEEDGYYSFKFKSGTPFDYLLLDENDEILINAYGRNIVETVKLDAEKTYYVITYSTDSNRSGTSTITVSKPLAPTSLTLFPETDFSDYVGRSYSLGYKFSPDGCYEEPFTLTSSNPEIVAADPYEPYISLIAPGTATVTATTESGLTDSVAITVLAVPELKFNEEKSFSYVSLNADEKIASFTFTPEEDGLYSLKLTGARNTNFESDDLSIYTWIESESEIFNFELTKGETYYFTLNTSSQNAFSFKAVMTNALLMEKLEITSLPQYTTYYEGFEDFEFFGLTLKATMSDGTEANYNYMTDDRLAGYDVEISSLYDDYDQYEKTVITCAGKTVEFTFVILENPVDRLELVQGTLASYLENSDGHLTEEDTFFYNTIFPYDAKVEIFYKDGSRKIVSLDQTPDLHYRFDWDSCQYDTPWKVGVNNTIVSYLGAEVILPITVLPSSVESIEYVGEAIELYENADGFVTEFGHFYYYLDFLENVKIKINKKDGTSQILPFSAGDGYYNFDYGTDQYEMPWVKGQTNYIDVYYQGQSCRIPLVIVENPVESIDLLNAPTKNYYYGDVDAGWFDPIEGYFLSAPEDLTGLSFRIYYVGGNHQDVSYADLDENRCYQGAYVYTNLEGDGPFTKGSVPVTLTYMGKSATYDLLLLDSPVLSLEVVELPEGVIEDDWQWPDLRGTKIKINYKDNSSETVTFTYADTDVEARNSPTLLLKVGDSTMEICYSFAADAWVAKYLGATVKLQVPYRDEPNLEKIELISFDPRIEGTRILVTYSNGNTEEITLGKTFVENYGDDYTYGFVETSEGFSHFQWQTYSDERSYGILDVGNGSFIVSLAEPDTIPGDVDGNEELDIDDVIHLLFYLTFPDSYPVNQAVDFDGNGAVDIDDVIQLLFHLTFPDSYPLH